MAVTQEYMKDVQSIEDYISEIILINVDTGN